MALSQKAPVTSDHQRDSTFVDSPVDSFDQNVAYMLPCFFTDVPKSSSRFLLFESFYYDCRDLCASDNHVFSLLFTSVRFSPMSDL